MASPGGITSSSSSISEEEKQLPVVDERKQRRMLSNRESARRSRLRKQKHLDGLTAQVVQLRNENNEFVTRLNITNQHYLNIESENSILRAQMAELSSRLESLNEITRFLNGSNNSECLESETGQFQSFESFMNPWNSVYTNSQQQPIFVASSAEMFEQ